MEIAPAIRAYRAKTTRLLDRNFEDDDDDERFFIEPRRSEQASLLRSTEKDDVGVYEAFS